MAILLLKCKFEKRFTRVSSSLNVTSFYGNIFASGTERIG